ncbi:hypothetical protein [Streptomyces globisporus]|uniref:hypothetical protein n=1 Tax=Streptomyces globisporus TaxID=1908 RepID=UPI000A86B9EC|nr:hypothetical protein [Streptomyces globisporus]
MGHAAVDPAVAAHDMTDTPSSLGMLSAHLLAALLSGLWTAYGERAVFRLVRTLSLGLFRPVRLLLAAVVPYRLGVPASGLSAPVTSVLPDSSRSPIPSSPEVHRGRSLSSDSRIPEPGGTRSATPSLGHRPCRRGGP